VEKPEREREEHLVEKLEGRKEPGNETWKL
jgi:hypothetical protein